MSWYGFQGVWFNDGCGFDLSLEVSVEKFIGLVQCFDRKIVTIRDMLAISPCGKLQSLQGGHYSLASCQLCSPALWNCSHSQQGLGCRAE